MSAPFAEARRGRGGFSRGRSRGGFSRGDGHEFHHEPRSYGFKPRGPKENGFVDVRFVDRNNVMNRATATVEDIDLVRKLMFLFKMSCSEVGGIYRGSMVNDAFFRDERDRGRDNVMHAFVGNLKACMGHEEFKSKVDFFRIQGSELFDLFNKLCEEGAFKPPKQLDKAKDSDFSDDEKEKE
jgi:hypothetical protein